MTIHSSLRGIDTLTGERSVLKRTERIAKLAKDGKFDEESSSVWGLPKVRTKFKVVSGKKAKALAEQTEDAALAERFAPIAKALADSEGTIVRELNEVQGPACDVGGYYQPNPELAAKAMRPSATLNAIIDG